MKKLLFVVVLFFIASFNLFAQQYDFDKITWGMSKNQVMTIYQAEKIYVNETDSEVLEIANKKIGNNIFVVRFYFENNLLNSVTLILDQVKPSMFPIKYSELQLNLIQRYGQPIQNDHTGSTWFTYRSKIELVSSMGIVLFYTKKEAPAF